MQLICLLLRILKMYAPMLLGLLVLLVAVLISLVIAVLAWKRRQMAEGLREMQLCTAALERAEKSKSETVANTSHELRTPLIGVIGMIDELLESRLEECQKADLVDARACAGETVDLINRVLDLAKLQAGRLQLETLPCCLRRIVHEATLAASATSAEDEPIAPGKNQQAHAVSNAAGGRVAFHVCCIPPPPSPHASTSCLNLPCASAPAAPSRDPPLPHTSSHASHSSHSSHVSSHASHCSHASSHASHHLPRGSPAWHQLSASVRRFPPATHLVRFRQHLVATTKGAAQAEGTSETPVSVTLACLTRPLQRLGASDSGGGIPPEEMRWVLDPHGDSHHAASYAPDASVAPAGGDDDEEDAQGAKLVTPPRPSFSPSHSSFSPEQVAEMRGDMAVLSHTTILLALPMGAEEDNDSDCDSGGDGEWDEEEVQEQATPHQQQHESEKQQAPLQEKQQRSARAHSHLKPRAGIFTRTEALEGAGKAEGVSPAVAVVAAGAAEEEEKLVAAVGEKSVAAVGKAGRRAARSHSLPKPLSHTDAMGDTDGGQVRAVGVSGRQTTRAQSLPRLRPHTEGAAGWEQGGGVEEAEVFVRAVLAGQSVAVVDDNAVNRMVARRTLQGYGAHVLLLPSGEDALQALSSAVPSAPPSSPPIHLLLLDLHMPPGIDGFETARQIRALEKSKRSGSNTTQQMPEGDNTADDAAAAPTPPVAAAHAVDAATEASAVQERLCIIALTADLDVGVKRACLEAGMDGAVRKPIVAQELLSALITEGFGAGAF
ncbi:unnamed protein product [Closterium sp. Yama58-4]|nr:unnamed protein product [Closterium sp. Yama58-4]